MTTLKQTGLRIPEHLNNKLAEIAEYLGVTKNGLIIQILWEYLERKEEG